MIKIKTSSNFLLIQQLQTILEESNIESRVEENSGLYIDASGNITTYSLLVHDEDEQRALDLLKEYDSEEDKPHSCGWCPECGSEDITKEEVKLKHSSIAFLIIGIIAIAISFIIQFYIFFYLLFIGGILSIIQYFRGHTEERYVCNKCSHRFRRI